MKRPLEEQTSGAELTTKIAKSADRFLLEHRHLDIYSERHITVIFFTNIGWERVHGGKVQNDLKSKVRPSH